MVGTAMPKNSLGMTPTPDVISGRVYQVAYKIDTVIFPRFTR